MYAVVWQIIVVNDNTITEPIITAIPTISTRLRSDFFCCEFVVSSSNLVLMY
jgi:hypothetical protein